MKPTPTRKTQPSARRVSQCRLRARANGPRLLNTVMLTPVGAQALAWLLEGGYEASATGIINRALAEAVKTARADR